MGGKRLGGDLEEGEVEGGKFRGKEGKEGKGIEVDVRKSNRGFIVY